MKYLAIVEHIGQRRTIPVQAMSEHEVRDHARIMAGFEFGWEPSRVSVQSFVSDPGDGPAHKHDRSFTIVVRLEGGEPESYTLMARDAECAEGLAVLHCADKSGRQAAEIDVISVTPN